MAVCSKTCLPYNCYEIGHPWCTSCTQATLSVAYSSWKESFKIYSSIYLVTALIRRQKLTPNGILRIFRDILQSSCFLMFSGAGFLGLLCLTRNVLGHFGYISAAYIPSFVASLMAILIERRSRRGILTLYVMNVASETLFKMAQARGKVHNIPYGDVILFSVSMAVNMYLLRKNLAGKDYVATIIRYIMGPSDKKVSDPSLEPPPPASKTMKFVHGNPLTKSVRSSTIAIYLGKILDKIRGLARHVTCPHRNSCIHHCSTGLLRGFLIGYGVQTVLNLLSVFPKFLRNAALLRASVLNQRNLKFGLFLGSFASIFKMVSCILRWSRNCDDPGHAIPAGLLAGLSVQFAPNLTLTLHLGWKTLQTLFELGAGAGYFPTSHAAMILLYAASTAVLFHAAALEPQNLRPAYMKFLERLGDGRMGNLNREILDMFGTKASLLFQDQKITLHPKFVSEEMTQYLKEKGSSSGINISTSQTLKTWL